MISKADRVVSLFAFQKYLQTNMLQATTSRGTKTVDEQLGRIVVNDMPLDWTMDRLPDGRFQIFSGNKIYTAELIPSSNRNNVTVIIEGYSLDISIKSLLDLKVAEMVGAVGSRRSMQIISPMPGLIMDIKVANGDQISTGLPLIVLEAMKMENVIQAPSDGVVKNIRVSKGDRVEKGQVLIEF